MSTSYKLCSFILGWGSFTMSYCISEMQHWGNQLVALLWLYWSPLGWQIKRNNNMVSKTFSAPWAAAESCRKRESGISMKFFSRWKHEVLHWLWTWENSEQPPPTPADDITPQLITDCGNLPLDLRRLGFGSSPLFLQNPRLFISKWDTKFTFHLTRGLPIIYYFLLFNPRNALLMLSLVQEWYSNQTFVSWRYQCVVTFNELNHRQSTRRDSLPGSWIELVTPLVCARFPTTFNFPLLYFDTALAEQSTFSAMTFCDLTSLWRVLGIRTTPTWVRLHVLK